MHPSIFSIMLSVKNISWVLTISQNLVNKTQSLPGDDYCLVCRSQPKSFKRLSNIGFSNIRTPGSHSRNFDSGFDTCHNKILKKNTITDAAWKEGKVHLNLGAWAVPSPGEAEQRVWYFIFGAVHLAKRAKYESLPLFLSSPLSSSKFLKPEFCTSWHAVLPPSIPSPVTSSQFLRTFNCISKYLLMFWELWDFFPHLYCHLSNPWSLSSNTVHPVFFFFFKHFCWSIIALKWCVSFCFITKWISCTYTYISISSPSWVSLPPSLSHPSRWSQSTELISLCNAAASH